MLSVPPRVSPQAIPGHQARSVEALCWGAGERLFGAGLSGDITEYDLQRLRPARAVDGFGGPIWSMVANSGGTRLAVSAGTGTGWGWGRGRDPAAALPELTPVPADRLRGRLGEALPGGAWWRPV